MKGEVRYIHDEATHNKLAAREILPLVFSQINPRSVLDVGCGLGTWLAVCSEMNIVDYMGVDGDYVDKHKLTISIDRFRAIDLRSYFDLERRFDLVICLEVAEHLEESSADDFVASLIKHGDSILFSAAIPGQGGQNHVNEQWPDYWQEKFKKHGYYFHDCLRAKIWENANVEWWYKQNIFLVDKNPSDADAKMRRLVHPVPFNNLARFKREVTQGESAVKVSGKLFARAFVNSLKRFISIRT